MASPKVTRTPNSSKLSLEWFRGKTDTKSFEDHLLNSTSSPALMQLRKIVEDKLRELDSKERSVQQFSNPNWAYQQAFENGRKKELQAMLDLLAFVKKE